MKNTLILLMLSILMDAVCAQNRPQQSDMPGQKNIFNKDNISVLDFYRQYSSFTDPGEYAYLYKNLPDSLPELCSLIKSQSIHPYAELPRYRDLIPRERWDEYLGYPSVKSILEGLHKYDSRGLVKDRKPEDRLVLGCQQNAILLASILKYRGIPTRVRTGHATYFNPAFHLSHTICEVWNEYEKRWMLVDPSTNMVDFSSDKFDFSYEAWLQMQKGEIDPNKYGNPGQYTGLISIVGKISPDMAAILGTEYPINQYAPILEYVMDGNNRLTAEHIETLNRISELMKNLDAKNLSKLQDFYNNTPEIQITKTFELNTKTSENNTKAKNPSTIKPNIEFVDIPAGTFMMGSPVTEPGRKDDEIQHQVTLSAFKMSKYCITFKQFDAFCEATGREKPFGFNRGNMPVSQVSWYDAKAFADWMGCRLPTEAEFEYATRANTTTPFYTGDSLTLEQAYFNNLSGREAMPVGSFPPNAFGLYDMHGNMVEWCSDWYGKYNINEKMNPKGPETGQIKVFRGGGFWNPAWKCRSACRAGDPPGNRGAGLSFRIVKYK